MCVLSDYVKPLILKPESRFFQSIASEDLDKTNMTGWK